MKLANYVSAGNEKAGIVSNDSIFDISDAAKKIGIDELARVTSVDTILRQNSLDLLENNELKILSASKGIPLNSVKLQSPVLFPDKIFLAAVNYASHTNEQDAKPISEPYFFTKFKNAIIGLDDPILVPKISVKVDWEVELAVVIGRRAKNIAQDEAMQYVAGYTIANDISFRDLQFPAGWPQNLNPLGQNWVKGKGLDNSFPVGPWLVTRNQIPDPHNLELSLSVNGETKQKSNTSEMVFKIEKLIEYLSAGLTLEPGDIISTGTPMGVAAFTGSPYLEDGDDVEARITDIGVLRNRVVAEGKE